MPTRIVDAAEHPPLSHGDAMSLLETELDRTLDVLRSFDHGDWAAPTACPDWDVHDMYLHVLGACEASASIRENLHQMLRARRHRSRHGGPLEAALSGVQVRERAALTPAELVERLAGVAPRTLRKRTTTPAVVRRLKFSVDGPVTERWTLGYLIDTIYLRDLWMHRVDATDATRRELVLTPDHDGVIVSDVVAEWSRRHGLPFTLTLTGPAGGLYSSVGSARDARSPEAFELDAVEFCRALAGRSDPPGLPATIVPF